MVFHIPDDLNRDLMPLAWMIGHWEGDGHGAETDGTQFEFGCQIDFTENGGDFLHYICQTYYKNPDGTPARPLRMETGYWRPRVDSKSLTVVMTAQEGWSELWSGSIDGAKIEMRTDTVVRADDASVAYTAGQRLYGQVNSDLLWTFDRSVEGDALKPYMWAQLKRA
ncbi:FABP family protein [Cutibacterium granulosum]|jgi:UPF0678 fatty acid-binding protein-like protein PPA0347|uniref:FABP family protein n=1 Tax=Cutibacterium granulosum TaxID=33011 RepID=UPI0025725724|nr:FABP family protein [Cutibacterium granulosum]MDU1779044.1 FABP family protein [Propionibacterium sp.]MDU1524564.1 FABP family protein [Cutibacterium granulosum]MDU1863487.1 FABP family protein [Propionibacterium sp.]MDU4677647.1 FABP family protein [Cutibacterium granulosum]MDU7727361.1 FABP family protein [Cutibacterium granulosum]